MGKLCNPTGSTLDWDGPNCNKCYHQWLHRLKRTVEEDACEGTDNGTVCIDYYPPVAAPIFEDRTIPTIPIFDLRV